MSNDQVNDCQQSECEKSDQEQIAVDEQTKNAKRKDKSDVQNR